MSELRKYWFEFEKTSKATPLNLGCGVTSHSYDDAMALLRERVFGPNGPPRLVRVLEDVELKMLERNHVVPNVGDMNIRGIWFPQGY